MNMLWKRPRLSSKRSLGFLSLVASLVLVGVNYSRAEESSSSKVKWALVIHGGAGSTPKNADGPRTIEKRKSLENALAAGQKILSEGGSSLDAVETVVRMLEDDPRFNAGKGAVKNADGQHELDASIMDGKSLACGAVAGVTTVKNPISLARRVMTETRHVLLQGDGAERFADEQKVDRVDNEHFSVSLQDKPSLPHRLPAHLVGVAPEMTRDSYRGTVGCVALDMNGNLAAATSTGGLSGKQYGRVGDSPIVGAGTYANDKTCGVSCTGTGEEYIRHAAAFSVSALMEFKGLSATDAVSEVLRKRLKPGDGGMIALSRDGEIVADYTTGGMAHAMADSTGRYEVHWGDKESGLKE